MVLRIVERQILSDNKLPAAELAAHMRLGDNYASVSGQEDRLQQRLRAALSNIDDRLGTALINQTVVLEGPGSASRLGLPLMPLLRLDGVEEIGRGDPADVAGAELAEDAAGAYLWLPRRPKDGSVLRVTVRAGFGLWEDVPPQLAHVVLVWAEALDMSGKEPKEVETMLAPWRRRRLGAAV